jgi:sulfur relay (sulfurtransferase) complex TusBCD TusD component (DsrE family)
MNRYMLIESRDPFDSPDTGFVHDLSRKLVEGGHEVTIFLVQNGVLPARPCVHSAALTSLAQAGVKILADDFSLRERGIPAHALVPGVSAAALDVVIDGMADGAKTIWH